MNRTKPKILVSSVTNLVQFDRFIKKLQFLVWFGNRLVRFFPKNRLTKFRIELTKLTNILNRTNQNYPI